MKLPTAIKTIKPIAIAKLSQAAPALASATGWLRAGVLTAASNNIVRGKAFRISLWYAPLHEM